MSDNPTSMGDPTEPSKNVKPFPNPLLAEQLDKALKTPPPTCPKIGDVMRGPSDTIGE